MSDVAPALSLEELMSSAGWLRRLAGGLLREDAGADDAVQETLLSALQRPPRDRGRLRGWLGAVLTNRVRTGLRGGRRRQRALAALASAPVPPVLTPEEALARRELQRLVADALLELTEAQRQVVILRYFEELDSAAIGLRLGLPPGTVRWRLGQALAALRDRLDARDGSRWRAMLLPLPLPLALARPLPRRSALTALVAGGSLVALGSALVLVRGQGAGRLAGASPAPVAARPAPFLPRTRGAPLREAATLESPAASDGAVGDLAPFSGVRWQGERPEVEVGERWAELLAVDGLSTEAVILECQRRYGSLWRKRLSEDLVDVLTELGRAPGMSVTLTLRDLATGATAVVAAPLTRENRNQVLRRNHQGLAPPAPSLLDQFARVSPFDGLRYRGDLIEVELDGDWRGLASVNGVATDRLVGFARQRYGRLWRKRIAEDLVEVLRDLGTPLASLEVDVVVHGPGGPERRRLPLTEEKRRRVRETWATASRG
jgi:RNA polymerase sigma factor (sigma-70 family)